MIRAIGRESLRSGVVCQAYPSRFDLDSQTGAKYSHRSAKNYFSSITSHPTSPSGSTELAEVLRRSKPPHQSSVALCTPRPLCGIRLANHTLAQAVVCEQRGDRLFERACATTSRGVRDRLSSISTSVPSGAMPGDRFVSTVTIFLSPDQ